MDSHADVDIAVSQQFPSTDSFSSADEDSELIKSKEEKMTGWLLLLAFLAAIGGFLFGYDTGVMSGAMISLRENFGLTSFYQELVVSGAIAAAAVFALLAGVLNDAFGRKPVILLSSVVFTVGSVVMAAANVKEVLLFGRFIVGAGVGLASMTVPMYLAESAPAHLRGQLVTMNNLFITGGQFVASIVDGVFFGDRVHGWRYMLGLAAVPSSLQLVTFIFMPESPRWLVAKQRRDEARRVLLKLRGVQRDQENGRHRVERELREIEDTHMEFMRSEETQRGGLLILRILSQPWTRRALFVGCGLQLIQQLAGINTVMYYSASILSMAGIRDPHTTVWLSAATAGVNMVFTVVGLYLVERWGRRPLTLASLVGVALALVVLAVAFGVADSQAPLVNYIEDVPANFSGDVRCNTFDSCLKCISSRQCGFCYSEDTGGSVNGSCLPLPAPFSPTSSYGRCASIPEEERLHTFLAADHCPSRLAWLTLFGLVLYLACFAPGMGPMPWTINSEIYPLWARSTAISCATAVNWVSNLVVSLTFLTLTEALTKAGAFSLYIGLVTLGLIFVAVFVPETKGKRLEEIEKHFRKTTRSP